MRLDDVRWEDEFILLAQFLRLGSDSVVKGSFYIRRACRLTHAVDTS